MAGSPSFQEMRSCFERHSALRMVTLTSFSTTRALQRPANIHILRCASMLHEDAVTMPATMHCGETPCSSRFYNQARSRQLPGKACQENVYMSIFCRHVAMQGDLLDKFEQFAWSQADSRLVGSMPCYLRGSWQMIQNMHVSYQTNH